MAPRVAGAVIERVWRRAKRIVLSLSTGEAFAIEPRMTGLMLVDEIPDAGHLRLEWVLTATPGCTVNSLWFWDRRGLGTIRLLTPEQQADVLGPGNLGPDALEMTREQWKLVCRSTRTAIKVALLNQKKVAGIGNLYASEILHRCRISPELSASDLSAQQVTRLAEAVPEILAEAIRYEGSTLSDGTYRNALNRDGGFQNAHRVYDREGERCPTCGRGTIIRIVQAQRSTFFCRICQPVRRRRKR